MEELRVKEKQRVVVNIRKLESDEMYILDQIADSDGRNPGLNDSELLYNADRNGFIAAIQGTEVTGTISFVSYANNLAFIGLHIVAPHLRNSGLFEKLLSVVMNSAGERNIGTNCREEHVPLYESAGFKPAFKIVTYEGTGDGIYNDLPPCIISPLKIQFDKLYNYYKKFFPYERKLFTGFWINQPGSLLFGKYENDEYKGYGLFKPCRKGYRLSPLISHDAVSAKEILKSLVSHFPEGTPYYLDIPEPNKEGVMMAEELKMKKIGERIRMYHASGMAKEHEISLKNIYSYTSLEIG